MQQLVDVVFPNLSNHQYDSKWMSERAILAPTNVQANMINDIASDMFPGNAVTCTSADSTIEAHDDTRFPSEFLNSL